MATAVYGAKIAAAQTSANLSQRSLGERTGISQPTLSRIVRGERTATMPELIRIAEATGVTVAYLAGSAASDRVQCAARASDWSDMAQMYEKLLHFVELDDYLDDQAIPASS
ncbi:hypothetical protein NCCP2495_24950 [Dietzia sp. NCCP-2495]|uniref:helix-turn-helix domain-containing protein n=1 Tax=Dietzia sp. NCCP-2495 TaxID=2934675 RepID=UPI002231ADCC|nr:helix-turn-helix transcriptional regulator [Dietzia sp. NCCP-2495]GLB64616.1 hypothetical protein NCCP2495_24950 [Dietzia sp. NCCP-2495]